MTKIIDKVKTEVKNWLDKKIDPTLRNSSEVNTLSGEAIEKITNQCENNVGYAFGMSDEKIIDTVNSYFTNYFYN